jgi:type IV pilus assembly protein PilC
MNHDDFAFLNQQLAAMLREGIPLEGALKELCAQAHRGKLTRGLEKTAERLRAGEPLEKAATDAGLPPLYCEMLRLGRISGDLPAVLTLAADYYRRVGALWTRLRALLTYPLLVLLVSLGLSLWFAVVYQRLDTSTVTDLTQVSPLAPFTPARWSVPNSAMKPTWSLNLWVPPALVGLATISLSLILLLPNVREYCRWRIGPFKDASLAQLAAALQLLSRQGVPLRESFGFAAEMEKGGVRAEIKRWITRHAEGHARFSEITNDSKTIPPLFRWIVASSGDDLAAGFANAAELYGERARRRGEILLNLVLPCALMILGLMIMGQVHPFLTSVFDVFTPVFQAGKIFGQ